VPRTQQGRRGTLRRARPGAPGACLRGHQQPEGSSNDSPRAPAASPPVSAERIQAGGWSVQTRAPTASISRSPRHQRPATPSPPSMSRSSWSVRPRVWSLVLVLVVARPVVCNKSVRRPQPSMGGHELRRVVRCEERVSCYSARKWPGARSTASCGVRGVEQSGRRGGGGPRPELHGGGASRLRASPRRRDGTGRLHASMRGRASQPARGGGR